MSTLKDAKEKYADKHGQNPENSDRTSTEATSLRSEPSSEKFPDWTPMKCNQPKSKSMDVMHFWQLPPAVQRNQGKLNSIFYQKQFPDPIEEGKQTPEEMDVISKFNIIDGTDSESKNVAINQNEPKISIDKENDWE